MPVMFIVDVGMAVLEELVLVPVFVSLAEMEPESQRHQPCGGQKQPGRLLPIQDQAERRSDEWRQGEKGAGSRRSQLPESEHETHEAEAVAQEAHEECSRNRRGWRQPGTE